MTVFPGESKKSESNNDDKHIHGQVKRGPSTLCWGNKANMFYAADVYLSLAEHEVGLKLIKGDV